MYSIKEVSELLKCSKSTVHRAIAELKIEPIKSKNKFVINSYDLERISEYINPNFFEDGSKRNLTNVRENETKNVSENESETFQTNSERIATNHNDSKPNQNDSKTIQNDSENVNINKIIELLQKELEQKDKQINDLNDRLAEVNRNLGQEQSLRAMAEQRLLALEQKEEEPIDQESDKKKWRFWGRK